MQDPPIVLWHNDAPSPDFVFLDRDGVIIENRSQYVLGMPDVEFLPGATRAITELNQLGRSIAVVTNQSAIGRGLLTVAAAVEIHQSVIDTLTAGGATVHVSAICPHAPTERCGCRKPVTGLIEAIAEGAVVDSKTSWLVGDALSDMACAEAASLRHIMVRTGRGNDQLARYQGTPAFPVVADLAGAAAIMYDDDARQ